MSALFALVFACLLVTPARADVPYLTVSGSLSGSGQTVQLSGLTGQSSCSFFLTGTPGSVAIEGQGPASGANWTALTAEDYGFNAAGSTFTPTAWQAYQFAPSSLANVRIRATGAINSTVYMSCSNSAIPIMAQGGASSLSGLSDVSLSSPTNNQVLTYNSTTAKWVNATPSSGGGGSGVVHEVATFSLNMSANTCTETKNWGTEYLSIASCSSITVTPPALPTGYTAWSAKSMCNFALTSPAADDEVNVRFAGSSLAGSNGQAFYSHTVDSGVSVTGTSIFTAASTTMRLSTAGGTDTGTVVCDITLEPTN